MGRFRVFSKKETLSSSDLNQRKNGDEMMKYLRSKAPKKLDNNVIVNYHNLEVIYFKSYQAFMNATKSYYDHLSCCYECGDTPVKLEDGVHSEICYDELYQHIKDCDKNDCKECDKILRIKKKKELNLFVFFSSRDFRHIRL